MSTTTRLTIEQYDQMIADGVFEKGLNRERVELIDGELRQMSPIGPPHENVVDLLARWSFKVMSEDHVRVRIQSSVGLPKLESVPEPDVAWVRERDYSRKRPTSADVLLIIEVADSSVSYDEGKKANLYAAAGIRDYWVVNIPARCVRVHRSPRAGRYGSVETVEAPEKVHPLAVPEVDLAVATLFSKAGR